MANILFSRAGGLLSLEGRSLLFSSCKASIAYAKGKDVEMAWRVPVFPAWILWSEGLSSLCLGSEPPSLPALLSPWKCLPGLARSDPFLKDMFSVPLQAAANEGLFSFSSPYSLEGRARPVHCQREGALCPGTSPVHALPSADTQPLTHVLPKPGHVPCHLHSDVQSCPWDSSLSSHGTQEGQIVILASRCSSESHTCSTAARGEEQERGFVWDMSQLFELFPNLLG